MGMSDSLQNMGHSMKDSVKSTSISLFSVSLRLISGFFLGITLALIGQQLIQYQTTSFIFVLCVVTAVFMKISSSWSIGKTLVFDLIFILIGQILKMYIYMAP